jgi:hypothetical protein
MKAQIGTSTIVALLKRNQNKRKLRLLKIYECKGQFWLYIKSPIQKNG